MNEKTTKLVEAFTSLQEMTEYFQHRFANLLKVQGVRYDDFKLSDVNLDGFTLTTDYTRCGDTDYTEHWFPITDLEVDVDDLNARENARIAAENAARQAREEAERVRQAALTELRDRKEYERLKTKFEAR